MRSLLVALSIFGLLACAARQQRPSAQDQFRTDLQDSINRTREKRQAYIDAHPNLSREFRAAILDGKILPGMTKEDVLGIEQALPPVDCPSSRSVDGEVWDYCAHPMRVGPIVTPEMHETVSFDKSGHVVSVTKSGAGPLRNAFSGAPL
jgi:hypothetical protein